jgi:hypothetical protein
MQQRNLVPGLLLIGLGLYLALVQVTAIGGESIVALFGLGFLVAFAIARKYAYLVVGGIMTGLGTGIVVEERVFSGGAPVVIGLGLGFLAIYVIDLVVNGAEARWWPVIPGGIITFVGGVAQAETVGYRFDQTYVWPIVLIGIGVVILLTQVLRGRRNGPGTTTEPGTEG